MFQYPHRESRGRVSAMSTYHSLPDDELLSLAQANPTDPRVLSDIYRVLSERKSYRARLHLNEIQRLLVEADVMFGRSKRHQFQTETARRNQRRAEGYFDWPRTDAPASRFGLSGDHFHYQEGLLKFVGYQTGEAARSEFIRRDILDWVFHNELPRVKSPVYMAEWGAPKTPDRLRKMANCLATFTRNAKRRVSADCGEAISQWQGDLNYLYTTYYIGRFNFAWAEPDDEET